VFVVFVVGRVFDIVAHLETDVAEGVVGIAAVVVVGVVGKIEADITDFVVVVVVVAGVAVVVVGVVAMLEDRRRNPVGQRSQRRILPPGWEMQRMLQSD